MKPLLMTLLIAFTFGPGFLRDMIPTQDPSLVLYDELVFDGSAPTNLVPVSL